MLALPWRPGKDNAWLVNALQAHGEAVFGVPIATTGMRGATKVGARTLWELLS